MCSHVHTQKVNHGSAQKILPKNTAGHKQLAILSSGLQWLLVIGLLRVGHPVGDLPRPVQQLSSSKEDIVIPQGR